MTLKTIPIEGTFALVSYEPDTYSCRPVYLHAAGQRPTQGQQIGVLGLMNRHGTLAQLGTPSGGIFGEIAEHDVKGWFTGHVDQATAALEMVGWHLGHVPTDPRLMVHPNR